VRPQVASVYGPAKAYVAETQRNWLGHVIGHKVERGDGLRPVRKRFDYLVASFASKKIPLLISNEYGSHTISFFDVVLG